MVNVNEATDSNSVLESIKSKYKTAYKLFKLGNYDVAFNRTGAALKTMQDNNLNDYNVTTNLINLATEASFKGAQALGNTTDIMVDGLSKLALILPQDHPVTQKQISLYKFIIAKNSFNEANFDFDAGLTYLRESISSMQDPTQLAAMIKDIEGICRLVNQNYTLKFFAENKYAEMLEMAKKLYDLIVEFNSQSDDIGVYAQNLGVAYMHNGDYVLSSKLLNEAVQRLTDSHLENKDTYIKTAQEYLTNVAAAISLNAPIEDVAPVLQDANDLFEVALGDFRAGAYADALSNMEDAFVSLKTNSMLADPFAEKLIDAMLNMYKTSKLAATDQQALAMNILSKEQDMLSAGNNGSAKMIVTLAEQITGMHTSSLYSTGKIKEGIELAQQLYNAVNKAYPEGHPDISVFSASIGEGYINLGDCKTGTQYVSNAIQAMQVSTSDKKDTYLPILQNLLNECNVELLQANAKSLFIKLDQLCSNLGHFELAACKAQIMGEVAE